MGNHDPSTDALELEFPLHSYPFLELENLCFAHDFLPGKEFQIVGHYHPKILVKGIRGKCFLSNEKQIILPSFGSYTGGLGIHSAQFKKITANVSFNAFMVYKEKIWRVS